MTQENTWFNAVPYSHKWDEEDRTPIEGLYHGKIQVDADHEQKFWVYLLRSERGFEKLVGRNQLDKAMELIPMGSRVRVTNLGLEPLAGGVSERQFEVLIKIDPEDVHVFSLNDFHPDNRVDVLKEKGFITTGLDESP